MPCAKQHMIRKEGTLPGPCTAARLALSHSPNGHMHTPLHTTTHIKQRSKRVQGKKKKRASPPNFTEEQSCCPSGAGERLPTAETDLQHATQQQQRHINLTEQQVTHFFVCNYSLMCTCIVSTCKNGKNYRSQKVTASKPVVLQRQQEEYPCKMTKNE